MPHSLPELELALFRSKLESARLVRQAYLVRKRILHMIDVPCFVLGVLLERQEGVAVEDWEEVTRALAVEMSWRGDVQVIDVGQPGNFPFGRRWNVWKVR
jgi:hypothetical protein